MLGDKLSDVECGQNAGVRSFLLQTGHSKNNSNTNDKIFKNILEFAKFLKSKENLKS
jgi:phosphoglycolate phosphatase-like HAD superfamily hydrolase